ncbi:MAG: hypothetical protein ACOCP4_06020 [Candidatus Woesearchaeota archaeon]
MSNNSISVKGSMIDAISYLINIYNENRNSDNPKAKTVLFTPMGMIQGDIAKVENVNTDNIDNLVKENGKFNYSYVVNMGQKIIQQQKSDSENEYIDDTYILLLENVTIFQQPDHSGVIKIDQMMIFADQIIGASLMTGQDFYQE